MIEFHCAKSEFVIMCRRSNNAIVKAKPGAKLTLWLSNGLCDRLKGYKQCVYFASTNSDQVVLRAVGALWKIQMESTENNPVPRAFSLAWGCSENYVNLALAGFFAIKIICFAPSNLADTV